MRAQRFRFVRCDRLLHCDPLATKGLHLWYGYGFDPYCNLTDAEDTAETTEETPAAEDNAPDADENKEG